MSKRLYVTYAPEDGQERKKILKLQTEVNFSSMSMEIKTKFSLPSDAQYAFKGRIEEHGPFVEIDDMDDDILDDVLEVKFSQVSKMKNPCQPCNPPLLSSSSSESLSSLASTINYLEVSPQSASRSSTPSSTQDLALGSPNPQTEQKCPSVSSPASSQASGSNPPGSQQASTTPRSTKPLVFDAGSILQKHPKGCAILEEYNKNGYICPASRISLVSILVAELVAKCGNYPAIEDKHAMGRAVIDSFPNLKDPSGVTGYDHFYSSSAGQSGYFQDKLKNMRRSLPPSAKQKTVIRNSTTPSGSPDEFSPDDLLPDAEANELESFCKNATGDRNRQAVMRAMSRCASNRRTWIEAEKPFLSVILKRYPRYLDMPEIIDQDFKALHRDSSDCLLRRWASHAEALLKYCSTCQQERLLKVVRQYKLQSKEENEELTALYGFVALLRLLPSYNTRGKGRVSAEDTNDLLLKHYEVSTLLEEVLSNNTTKQPTLIAFGAKPQIHQIIMKIENYGFPFPSSNITSAVDILFKSHYTFNLEYSAQLSNFFVYLQTQIYGLKYSGKVPPRVIEIARALKVL